MTRAEWGRAALTLAAGVVLAWNLQRALDGITLRAAPASSYTIVVAPASDGSGGRPGGEIWLRHAIADGRAVRSDEIPRAGSWTDLGWALVHRFDGQPASLTLQGRSVTACFIAAKLGGVLRVEGTRQPVPDVDLFSDQESGGLTCLDLADGVVSIATNRQRVHTARTVVAFLPILVIAWLWKPWRRPGGVTAWIVCHVAVLHLLVWLTQAVGYNSDADGLFQTFAAFLSGHAASFPPGYSILLGVANAILPHAAGTLVTGVQHVMIVLALVGLRQVTRAFLSVDLANVSLLVTGSLPLTLFLPQTILTEGVAFAAMAGTLWAMAGRRPADERRRDLLAGVFCAIATVARLVPLPALAVPVFLVALGDRFGPAKAAVRSARVLLVAASALSIVGMWNWRGTGRFAIVDSTGHHFYNRVVTEQGLLDREGAATRRFLAIVGNRDVRVPHWEIGPVLSHGGLGYAAIEKLFSDVSWEGFRTAPVSFLWFSLALAFREYTVGPMAGIPITGADGLPARVFENEPLLGVRASAVLWRDDLDAIFDALWRVLQWMPLVGLVLLPLLGGRPTFLALVTLAAGYILTGTMAEFFVPRYPAAVVPFVLAVSPAPLAALDALRLRRHGKPTTELARPMPR